MMETRKNHQSLKIQWQTILSITLIFNFFTFSTSTVSAAQKKAKEKIRVACVGNSVTYGMGVEDREKNAYPVVLQRLLGDDYDVRNFGHSGATLLNHGHRPYTKLPEYQQALDFKADWVVIHLGLNDTDPRNWPNYGDEFIGDYRALIDSFREANPQAKVWICLMTPIFHRHPRFQTGTRDWHAAIQQRIRQIAATTDVGLIDLHTPLYAHPELLPDALHPNVKGAAILAQTVFSALTGDKGGLKPSPMYGNGMVLQRGDSIVLRGTANVGDEVLVTFNGVSQTVKSDSEGAWRVKFPSMEAGGPYRLSFESLSQRSRKSQKNSKNRTPSPSGEGWGGAITFDSVYVGEVWLCSGQSNMEFQLRRSSTAQEDVALFPQSAASRLLHLCDMSPLYSTDDNGWSPAVCDSVNQLRFLKKPAWKLATAENIKNFSAIAYHFGRVLADSLQVPIGIICNAVGGSTTESWIDRQTLEKSLPNILTDWYFGDYGQPWARNRALANIAQVVNVENDGKSTPDRNKTRLQRHPYEPCYLFEAGILPLDHYRIKGVAWYQGESNAHNIELHEQLFKMFRESWRRYFDRPVIFSVQLSSLNRPSWPAFRNSQRYLSLGEFEMVVSHDHGDSLDVHPRNKRPIGERLAWKALKYKYGRPKLVADGPSIPTAVQNQEGTLVSFSRDREGLHPSSGDRLIGFEVAGKDGIFHPAEARVVEGRFNENKYEYVLVTCSEVAEPVEVRYAWQPFTRANLVNGAGLPASTFKIKVVQNYHPKIIIE